MERPSRFKIHLPQFVAGLLIWVAIAVVVLFTRDLPFKSEGAPGPRFMPFLLAICLGVLNLLYWGQAFSNRGERKSGLPGLREMIRPTGFVLIAVLLILLWEHAGAVLTILTCSLLELKILEGYSWKKSLLVGLIISVITWVLFQYLLGVPLPGGLFEGLSYLRI